MARFATKHNLLDDIDKEREKLRVLLAKIPEDDKEVEVVDGMTVKDFLAHRAEWGRMMLQWYTTARAGGDPAVPHERFRWNELKPLNAEILARYRDTPLAVVEADFEGIHDTLRKTVEQMSEEELFTKRYYGFTGSSDLCTYVNSATASHYRSARRHIARWWRTARAEQRA